MSQVIGDMMTKTRKDCEDMYTRHFVGSVLERKNQKVATVKGGTLPLMLPKQTLVWVYAYYKQWEGRTVRSVLRMMGRLPEPGDRIQEFVCGQYCRFLSLCP